MNFVFMLKIILGRARCTVYNYQYMTDLPNYLPTTNEMYGGKQEARQYDQGTDINIKVLLDDNVNPNEWYLFAVLKKDLNDDKITWNGTDHDGIETTGKTTNIRITSADSSHIKDGIYYLAIKGTNKQDLKHTKILFQDIISIVKTAADNYTKPTYQFTGDESSPIINVPPQIVSYTSDPNSENVKPADKTKPAVA